MKMNHVIVLQECNVSFCLLIEQMAVKYKNYCTIVQEPFHSNHSNTLSKSISLIL